MPARVDTVYVLSRVTLGADIKIVSPILATMKQRFPEASIVLAANRKSAELFEADTRVEHLLADYPRGGSMQTRLDFAHDLKSKLRHANSIVIDPDSRMTQLGLIPVCEPERHWHFPSRTAGNDGDNLSFLIGIWLRANFGMAKPACFASKQGPIPPTGRYAAISLGVGDNESKRVGGDFEANLIAALGARYKTIWLDRGAGGSEATRVTAAAEASGVANRVHFWEGSFAGFASIIGKAAFYSGYDSAGQHAAAAAGVPVATIFAGAPSDRFRARWAASGPGRITQIIPDGKAPEAVLSELIATLPIH